MNPGSMSKKQWVKLVCAFSIVFFALWFRLEYQAHTIVDTPLRADAAQYYSIGWNLVHHGVVSMAIPDSVAPSPDSYRSPGYPLLVALSIQLGGDEKGYHYLLLLQALLGALSVGLTIAIARQWLSFTYAIIAGLTAAIWPHLVTLSGYVLTETFFGFTLLLGSYLLIIARRNQRTYQYVLSGLVFAYSALINPAILLFPVVIAAVLFFSQRKFVVIFLLCALSFPVAWAARSAMLDSAKTSSGRLLENILAGTEPDFDYNFSPAALVAKSRVSAGVKQYRNDFPAALGMIVDRFTENPAFYANWYFVQKPLRFWQWSILGDGDIYVYPVFVSPFQTNAFFRAIVSLCYSLNIFLMAAAFCFVLVFSVKSFRHGLRDQDMPVVFITLLFVYATVLHSVLTPDPRYATPFRAFEILLALSLLAAIQEYIQKNGQSKLQVG